MPALGTFLLLASFVVAAYAFAASVAGARRRSPRLVESGVGAFYLVAALMAVGVGGHGARLRHEQLLASSTCSAIRTRRSRSAYKIASYWGGLDGSIMFWVFLLSIFGAIAVYDEP